MDATEVNVQGNKGVLPPRLMLVLFLMGVLCLFSFSRTYAESSDKKILLVTGVVNALEDERWQDLRIGFGLRNLIGEAFYETGMFRMLEEKLEIQQKLNTLAQDLWIRPEREREHLFTAGMDTARTLGVQAIAYGEVLYFGVPRSSFSVGVFHANRKISEIQVKLCLKDLRTDRLFCSKAKGKAATTAYATLFEYRKDSVAFDKTTVGMATRKAVVKAVKEIMEDYQKALEKGE